MTMYVQKLKGCKVLNEIEGIRMGYLFREKWSIKGKEVGATPYKKLLITRPPEISSFRNVTRRNIFLFRHP